MNNISKLFTLKAYRPSWFISIVVILPAIIAIEMLLYSIILSIGLLPYIDSQDGIEFPAYFLTVRGFAMIFCGMSFLVSVLVLFFTLPIYLFSRDSGRIERAGGLVQTCLKFIVGSGGAVLATLSFK